MSNLITAREIQSKEFSCTMYMADGPDGKLSLIKTFTAESAVIQGEEYFLKHYEPDPSRAGGWRCKRYAE